MVWVLAGVLLVSATGQARRRVVREKQNTEDLNLKVARVQYLTNKGAYLDKGAKDGVVAGDVLSAKRGRRQVSCTIEVVSENASRCKGTDLSDDLNFTLLRAPAASEKVTALRPDNKTSTQKSNNVLRGAAYPQVVFAGAKVAKRTPVWLKWDHEVRIQPGAQNSVQQEDSIGLWIPGMPIGFWDLRAYVQLLAHRWTQRSSGLTMGINQRSYLSVWEASVAKRASAGGFTMGVGRLQPWSAPGLWVLDGMVAGYRSQSYGIEVGAYAGAIPDLIALDVSSDRWGAGVYYDWQGTFAEATTARSAGRLGLLHLEDGRQRLEVSEQFQVFLSDRVQLALEPTLSRTENDPVHVDHVRASMDGRVGDHAFWGGAAQWNSRAAWAAYTRYTSPIVDASHAQLYGGWDRGDLTLRFFSGARAGATATDAQYFAGPELGIPRLFGPWGGLTVGYQEDFGRSSGRAVYTQSLLQLAHLTTLWVRLSVADEVVAGTHAADVGGFARVDWALVDWLTLRASLLGRIGRIGQQNTVPFNLVATLGFIGSL